MFKNIKWVRLTPDRPGRGGSKTGIHSFQQQPINDTYELFNAHVYRGYWRRDFNPATDPIAPGPVTNLTNALAIHGYVYPSLTDPSAQPSVAVLEQGVWNHASVVVYDITNATTRVTRPQSVSSLQAGVFQDINQRCFYGDGSDEGYIFDNRTPAIHAQPNSKLGIATPAQPLPLVNATIDTVPVVAGISPFGSGYIHYESWYLNNPDPNNPLGTCIIGDKVTATVFPSTPGWNTFPAQPGGTYTLLANAQTSNLNPFTVTGTISITTGTSVVSIGGGGSWPAGRKFAGLTITFSGYSFVVLTHGFAGDVYQNYDINGNSVNPIPVGQLYILGVYNGPTLTNVPYLITGCQVTLDPGVLSVAQIANSGTLGYSQSTASDLVQVLVHCVRANGQYRGLGNISVGPPIGQGTQLHVVNDIIMQNATINVHSGSGQFKATDVGLTIVIDLAASGPEILSTTIATFISSTFVTTLNLNSSGTNVINGAGMWGTDIFSVHDAAMDNNVTATLASASNPWTVSNVGNTVMVGAATAGGKALVTKIVGFTDPGHVVLAAKNTSGGAISGVQAFWQDTLAGTTTGPTYAYAWYDPETGHMSNISPLFQIPKPTTVGNLFDFTDLTPVFQIDPGYISYPDGASPVTPAGDAIRFSHIMFFRTLSTPGSSTLYPLGSLMPFVGKVHPGLPSTRGSWNPNLYQGWMGLPSNYVTAPTTTGSNYWYDFSSDSDLLLSGGFRAPQYTNEKPMALLRGGITQPGRPYQLAYWDRRTWLVDTQEPDKILFSCDEAQCPLGLPEESFPPTNFLRLPSVDGRVLGMRTVGDMLLITTERWAYIIAGNNESNYRLMKASSAMPGVGTYQMDEFPTYSGAEGEPSTLFYLGRDRIVYQWTVGANIVPISGAAQKQFDLVLSQGTGSLAAYQQTRLHCVSAWGRRLVVIALGNPVFWMIYDIDNQVWSRHQIPDGSGGISTIGILPMTTVYGLGIPVDELYVTGATPNYYSRVLSWVRDDQAASINSASLFQTFPMNFDGKKTRKQIVAANLHATTGTYQCLASVNEATIASGSGYYSVNFGPYLDPLDSIYAPLNPQPIDGLNTTDTVVLTASFDATHGTPLVGYRFSFIVQRQDALPANIYALDIAYIDAEDPGDGDG